MPNDSHAWLVVHTLTNLVKLAPQSARMRPASLEPVYFRWSSTIARRSSSSVGKISGSSPTGSSCMTNHSRYCLLCARANQQEMMKYHARLNIYIPQQARGCRSRWPAAAPGRRRRRCRRTSRSRSYGRPAFISQCAQLSKTLCGRISVVHGYL